MNLLDRFDLSGRVAVVTGSSAFGFLATEFGLPSAVVGFTPADVLRGILELAGVLLLTITFALGPPTVAGVTTTQFGTFAVILGFVLLHERPKLNQWAGIICTIVGVSLLAAIV